MSNIIKSSFVCINSVDARLINTKEELSNCRDEVKETPEKKTVVTRDINQALKEKEKMLKEVEANLKVKYQQVMEEANKKAEEIIAEAKEQAKVIMEESAKQGQEEGRKQGLSSGQEEINQIKEQLNNQKLDFENQYNEMANRFENDFMDIFANVFENISGILMDDKKDVILHLINQQINNVEKSNNYVIRVSKEDYDLVNNKKQMLAEYIGEESSIEIVETDTLSRNKCLIETDNSVIDCSIDTQIKNLIMDLRMLSKNMD